MGCESMGSGCWGRPDVVELTLASNGWAHVGKVMHTWHMICSTIEEYGAHGQMAGAVGVGHGMSMTMAEYASHRLMDWMQD